MTHAPSIEDLFSPDALGRKLREIALHQQRLRGENELLRLQLKKLTFLYEVGKAMGGILDLGALLEKLMDVAVEATKAERGFVMVRDEHGGLETKVARGIQGRKLEEGEFEMSRGIASRVVEQGRPVCITDVTGDQEFSQKTSILKLDLRSIMCAPLKVRDTILGVLYVDSRTITKNYTSEDLALFEALAQHAAIALENATLYRQLQDRNLERERTKRLAAMGQMAAAIAHEIRNPLGIISTASYFLRSTEESPVEDREEQYGIIDAEVRRANLIITDLLQFSRPRELQREDVDINALLEDIRALQEREPPYAEMQWRSFPGKDTQVVRADPEQLRQVFLNIFNNAMEACNGRGTITIRTRPGNDGVTVLIQDDGPGIAKDILPRVFDPFFSTKTGTKGTGLGLAISYGIIEKHGGSLSVRSTAGEGAVFRVFLPWGER